MEKILLEVIIVKKQNVMKLFKGKGFYVSLLAVILTVFAIGVLTLKLYPGSAEEELTDLNEPSVDLAEKPKVDEKENNFETAKEEQNNLLEDSTEDETKVEVAKQVQPQEKQTVEVAPNKKNTKQKVTNTAEEEKAVAVMNTGGKVANLKFDEEKGLLWPLKGDVIMNFSMSNSIYFQTLDQYKCNPAIVIKAENGSKVVSAAECIVTDIIHHEETGLTVVTSVGSNYQLTYGQLKDLKVEVGDRVEEGQVIGSIEKPTKYYTLEGSNLYFKVDQNDESVNPLLLLRD